MAYVQLTPILTTCVYAVAAIMMLLFVSPTPTHAGGAICTEITTESFSGFGAAYNLFSGANELIVRASCASDSFTPEIGSEATDASNFAAYTTGYYYDGSAWQAYSLSPGSGAEQYGDWILGDARGGAISYQGSPTFFAAYTCHWRGSDGWQCGCSSAACGSSAWQLQAVTPPGAVGGGGTGGGASGSGLGGILSRADFERLFPERNAFYTYDGLIAATDSYPAFANSGDQTTRLREAAAFLANMAHESGYLRYIEEIPSRRGNYCSSSGSCPCEPGEEYFGRGPIQLTWNYNYCSAGDALGLDLRSDPDQVAQNPTIAWQTALWFWMTQTGAGRMTAHDAMVDGAGFGETIRTINGALECNGGNPGQVDQRVRYYERFTDEFGVSPGGNLRC